MRPFYAGQLVVGSGIYPGSRILKGHEYILSSCEYRMNPVNGLWFWYVGVVGHYDWMSPKLFVQKDQEFKEIEFSEVLAIEKKLTSAN